MATTLTNGQIDTLAAAVAAPYGPLTRVTDVADLPEPNSEIKLEFTSALTQTVYLTVEEMQIAGILADRLLTQHGHVGVTRAISAAIDAIDVVNETIKTAADFTSAEGVELMQAIKTNLGPWIGGLY